MTDPTNLQFNLDQTTYSPGDTLSLAEAWVYDEEGTSDLSSVDVWLQNSDGSWLDVSDVSDFNAWSEDSRWGSFNYSLDLSGYSDGTYTLWGQAYDQTGAASNEFTQTFTVQNFDPTNLYFSTDQTTYSSEDTLNLTEAWVFNEEGTSDLSKVDVWLQNPDGSWLDVSDVSDFNAWSEDSRWGSFNYSLDLSGYSDGTYTLWGQAYDQMGAASNEFTQTFDVTTSALLNLIVPEIAI